MAIMKAPTSAASAAGMKRPRTVRFLPTVKYVRRTSATNNNESTTAAPSMWYNASELAAIKQGIRSDLHSLYAGQVPAYDTEDDSWRGLENYTQKHSKFQKHRKQRRAFLTQGVKDLQQRLGAESLSSELAIRKFSTIASRRAVQEAQKLAAMDNHAANQIYLDTFLVGACPTKVEAKPAAVVPMPPMIAQQGAPTPQLVMARTA